MNGNKASLISRALNCFKTGDLNGAEQMLKNILADHPNNFDALHLLGVINAIGGAHNEAELLYKKALRINENHEELRVNLTLALVAVGKFGEALVNVEKALSLNSKNIGAHLTHGNILRELRRHGEALTSFDRALSINPNYAKAWLNRGTTLNELKCYDEALASFDRALSINPDYAEAWSNRGNALGQLNRHDEALASFDRALSINPDYAEAWSDRGIIFSELKRHDEALANLNQALNIDPNYAEAWSNRGIVFSELKRHDEALANFDQALNINPDFAEAWSNRGNALGLLKRYDEALASFDRALAIESNMAYCFGDWLHAKMMLCDWHEIEDAFRMLLNKVNAGTKASNPFSFLAVPSSPIQQRQCAEIYVQDKFPGSTTPLCTNEKYSHSRIRVAYLSADFHNHATAYLMAGLFEAHDKARFETTAISFGPDAVDEMRARLSASFGRFIDVRNKNDREVALLLREMEIDIAIDLKGFTLDGRPGILAHRPAPVQVNYLGYPGTLGADYMDYILADRHVIPAEHQTYYAEKIVYLPDTYQVNDAGRSIAARTLTRAESKLPETGFVFCCFNNNYKIIPEVFDIWMRLLGRVKGSMLWLLESSVTTSRNLRHEAEQRGVAPERLVFAPRMRLDEHLARHRLADLFLDTLPINAHTTASDTLWAGLPVLTCAGNAFAGRVAASLLNAVGLPELVTGSLDEYEAMAFELATNSLKLLSLREKLARNRLTYPLFDTTLFTKHLESAYTKMWERQQSGLPPDHIYVEA